MAMKKVIITRNKWGRSSLKRQDNGKQCCLGFVCKVYGLPEDAIENIGYPSSLPEKLQKKLPKWLRAIYVKVKTANEKYVSNHPDVTLAAHINDDLDKTRTIAEKEEALKPIFRKHNIQLVFRGKADG